MPTCGEGLMAHSEYGRRCSDLRRAWSPQVSSARGAPAVRQSSVCANKKVALNVGDSPRQSDLLAVGDIGFEPKSPRVSAILNHPL